MKSQITFLAAALLLGITSFGLPVRAGSSEAAPFQLAQEEADVAPQSTSMTPRNNNQIAVEIRDGEFNFRGILRRSSGNIFLAQDRQVRVIYNREEGRVSVINVATGDIFYNYFYQDPQRRRSEGAL